MAQDPRCRLIRINLAKETAQVGLAMGLNVVEVSGKPDKMWAEADRGDVFEELDGYLSTRGGRVNWLTSTAQDVKKGRRSETDQMNGLVARKGRETSVPTPFTDAVIDAMHGIDDGSVAPGPSTIDRILKAVGRWPIVRSSQGGCIPHAGGTCPACRSEVRTKSVPGEVVFEWWSGRWESNPRDQLGRLELCH